MESVQGTDSALEVNCHVGLRNKAKIVQKEI